MHAVNAGCKDDLRGDDAHGLALEIRRDATDNGRVVEEALVAHADVGGKAGLGLFLGAERRDVARGGFG